MPTHTHASERYKSMLISFMRHCDSNASYSIHTVFSSEELSSIIPQEIVAWMKLPVFGCSDAGDDDFPSCGRSSTLAFHKKALSYFIPNKHLGWNRVSLSGNPTRSPEVNNLIKHVRRHEVRGEGVSLQVRRALTLAEFHSLVGMAPNSETFNLQVCIPCILKFQVHLIARVDDAAQVLMNKLRAHGMFDYALRVHLRWTKNCLEERDTPEQIILGASDQDFCVLTSLSIHLQYLLEFLCRILGLTAINSSSSMRQ